MKRTLKLLLVAMIATMALGFTACGDDDDVEAANIQGWYRQDAGYIIFKAMNFHGSTVTVYYRVEADNEPDWREWDDAAELPGHSDYYYGTRSSGSHAYTVSGNQIILDDGRIFTVNGGKVTTDGGEVYRKW